jgi:hypothetical protein
MKRDEKGRFLKGHKGMVGDSNPQWLGDKVTYQAVHAWIKTQKGKPNFCEGCGNEEARGYEWANKSGQYKRNIHDWLRLCTLCHRHFDNITGKANITKKSRIRQKMHKDNSSGYKGVYWHKISNSWTVHLWDNGKAIYNGIYKTKKEAAKAYNEAAIKLYGKYAWLNKL